MICGPAFSNSLQCGLCVNLTKLLLKRPTNFLAFSSQSYLLVYVSLGSKTFLLTFGSSVGISKLKYGITFVGALSISPFKILSIIPRVSLIEIRLPVPFQPVETKYALAPTFYIFFNNCTAFNSCILSDIHAIAFSKKYTAFNSRFFTDTIAWFFAIYFT